MADSGAPQPKASQQAARGPAAIVEDRVVRSAVPEPPLPDCDFATCLRNSWQQFKDRTALAVFMFEFPTHLRLLLKSPLLEDYDLSSLKVVSVAGSTVPPDLVTETKAKLKVFALAQGYGLTESFGAGTFTLGQNASSDCVGTPHFMSQLKESNATTVDCIIICF
ncbi:hypothetical protein V5799_010061 [Amblyomma americanum]|uniref:AMP-dependent synthetase/ligase domain-containing protein n=1 Tax=Amblyomma americanum TaxID=6943 RepID=A0AAQ4FA18_AMBAM